ncbi:MAG: metallophosphoesterase [Bacteroidia bacterium]|nr:MAG: metallophosphoesterase [Bacteroidia bacterium]
MKQIGILSDTHSYWDDAFYQHFDNCDEIWHAGDFGNFEVVEKLQAFKPLKGVFGNIDGAAIRNLFPNILRWHCEGVSVLMTHIGGYPGKYAASIKKDLQFQPPQLFICGHSHILKIQYDEAIKCLHINPGAAGIEGFHQVRTLVKLKIDGTRMFDCQLIELGKRGRS